MLHNPYHGAYAHYDDLTQAARLFIVGTGELEAMAAAHAKRREGNIFFLGQIPHTHVSYPVAA